MGNFADSVCREASSQQWSPTSTELHFISTQGSTHLDTRQFRLSEKKTNKKKLTLLHLRDLPLKSIWIQFEVTWTMTSDFMVLNDLCFQIHFMTSSISEKYITSCIFRALYILTFPSITSFTWVTSAVLCPYLCFFKCQLEMHYTHTQMKILHIQTCNVTNSRHMVSNVYALFLFTNFPGSICQQPQFTLIQKLNMSRLHSLFPLQKMKTFSTPNM